MAKQLMKQSSSHSDRLQAAKQQYWNANIRVVLLLLGFWFLWGCVLSICRVDTLNQVKLGGFPLGFWMAQQGTTLGFIGIISVYVWVMGRLDKRYREAVQEGEPR